MTFKITAAEKEAILKRRIAIAQIKWKKPPKLAKSIQAVLNRAVKLSLRGVEDPEDFDDALSPAVGKIEKKITLWLRACGLEDTDYDDITDGEDSIGFDQAFVFGEDQKEGSIVLMWQGENKGTFYTEIEVPGFNKRFKCSLKAFKPDILDRTFVYLMKAIDKVSAKSAPDVETRKKLAEDFVKSLGKDFFPRSRMKEEFREKLFGLLNKYSV